MGPAGPGRSRRVSLVISEEIQEEDGGYSRAPSRFGSRSRRVSIVESEEIQEEASSGAHP